MGRQLLVSDAAFLLGQGVCKQTGDMLWNRRMNGVDGE